MKIRNEAYTSLGNKQRLSAILEARARGDDDEVTRLFETCPRKNYRQADKGFTDLHDKLMGQSIEIQAILLSHALNYELARQIDSEHVIPLLRSISATVSAWRTLLQELDINPVMMTKAGYPAHPFVERLIEVAELLEPEDKEVEKLLEAWRPYFLA